MPPLSRFSLAVLLAVVPLGVGTAQEPLTLERAITLAVGAGPAAQAAAGASAVTVGRARTDAQWANPVLELRRENEGAPIPYDDFVTLTLPVDFTGRRFALRSALGASRVRGEADSLAVVRETEFGAARAWWDAWVAEQSAEVAQRQALRFAELARFDSLRAAEGAVAEAAALRTRLEAERASYAAAQAAGHAARMRGALAARLGRADARGLVLAAAPSLDALPPVDSLAIDAAVARALAARPDVRAAVAATRIADRRRAASRRGTLPDVGLSGGYKGTGGFSAATFGVILTPPIANFNGGAREASEGEWLLADAERRTAELRAANEVRAAIEAVRAMDDGTRGFDDSFLVRADLIAAAAEASYREGAATLTETLEALRAIADVRATGLQAIADRALTRLDLRRALGASALETP
jgi:cobalt-zinc-cadmium efflux system outer membrane protein